MKVTKGRGYVYALQYHIVWCTKYRKNILHNDIDKQIKTLIHEIAEEMGVEVIRMETDGDHIHLLVSCTPQHYIPDIIKRFKGTSARLLFATYPALKKQLWGGHLWNPSYFVSTVSEQTEDQIIRYIEDQPMKSRERGRPIKIEEVTPWQRSQLLKNETKN